MKERSHPFLFYLLVTVTINSDLRGVLVYPLFFLFLEVSFFGCMS